MRETVIICVVLGLIGAASLTCIILSIVTDRTALFLSMGLGLAGFGNAVNLAVNRKKKGNGNGFVKDGSIS